MALHVDIFKTDPLATNQRLLARAVLDHETVTIEKANDPAYWLATLETATALNSTTQPVEFFEALPDCIDGTYVYATQPHEESECPVLHEQADGGTAA